MFTRRAFVKAVGLGGAAVLAARRDAWGALRAGQGAPASGAPRLLLHNNENPLGPGEAVLETLRAALGEGEPAGRYPFKHAAQLHAAIAERFGVAPESVVTGCGSTQLLRSAVQMFTSASRPLVSGVPSYEECMGYAELIGTPVRAIPLDGSMRLDLPAMAEAAAGAGLVFLNNPNNPTATLWSGDAVDGFIERVLRASPETTILIDEAYHDYVTDPSYRSQVATAIANPRVLVARTFSKAHGMAGMRIGYVIGQPKTVETLASWEGGNALNVPGIVAAIASIRDQARLEAERARNTEARRFTLDWFAARGFAATASQTNFVFVNVRRPAREFREACREQGVIVARDFPPYEKSHVRISIGTLEEMQRASGVFAKVLGAPAKAA